MNSIITQVAVKVVEEISKNIEKNGISEIGKTAEDIISILKEGALELTKYCTVIKKAQNEKGEKKLEQILNYFHNNWESIVERLKGEHCGSCTEPLISHVLSERLSRNPIAWSKEGLSKMAMLRVYEENGGRITAKSIRVSRRKTDREKDYKAQRNGFEIYNKYADEQIKAVFGGNHDWSIFEGEYSNTGLHYGKITGTTVMLKSFARLKAV